MKNIYLKRIHDSITDSNLYNKFGLYQGNELYKFHLNTYYLIANCLEDYRHGN